MDFAEPDYTSTKKNLALMNNNFSKILSFCVYGDDPKYTEGMKRNIESCPDIYGDEWKIRVHIDDSVPSYIVQEYAAKGAQIFDASRMNIEGGMFWRFLPFIDESVDVFCVRDADSRISLREKSAVDEWLESDKSLHLMRDHPHHNYVIMGGMFGFNKIPNGNYSFIEDYANFSSPDYKFKKMDDMIFLHNLYRQYSHSAMSHDIFGPRIGNDSNRCTFDGAEDYRPFPTTREGKEFVGEIYDGADVPSYQRELL